MGTLNRILDIGQQAVNLTFISSYIPRKCGIATFTKDLTKAINDLNPHDFVKIIAMSNEEGLKYPPEVTSKIKRDEVEEYIDVANRLNIGSTDIVCLQHEYGLFGGDAGEYILRLLGRIRQPIVSTLHTVLSDPSPEQQDVLFRLAKLSEAVVVMTPDAKERLEKTYLIPADKIVVIHHGVTDKPKSIKASKPSLGWEGRPVMLMTGLLSENKGVEYVIKALPAIKKKIPNILFAIVGQTHPEIIKQYGEAYRESLQKMIKELGLEDNVQFVNSYLSLDDLLTYYDGCDIYLTPHLDAQQTASGTLAYALGMGKACISTPYIYAKEILADNRGMLVDFKNSKQISSAALKILQSPDLMDKLETASYRMGRQMSWPLVGERYLMLFRIVQETYGISNRANF